MVNQIGPLRLARGYSQADLARLLRVPAGTLGRWERDAAMPTPKNRKRLARRLGVSVEELQLGGEGS